VPIEVRSITEKTIWVGLHRILRKTVGVWTQKGHQGRLIFRHLDLIGHRFKQKMSIFKFSSNIIIR